jgi:hypothetical protein
VVTGTSATHLGRKSSWLTIDYALQHISIFRLRTNTVILGGFQAKIGVRLPFPSTDAAIVGGFQGLVKDGNNHQIRDWGGGGHGRRSAATLRRESSGGSSSIRSSISRTRVQAKVSQVFDLKPIN